MRYNYILINYDNDIYKYYYKDVNSLDYAYFDHGYPHGVIFKLLMKLHISNKINKIINLPFKELWIKRQIRQLYFASTKFKSKNKKVCFILFSSCLPMHRYGLLKWIKYYFPDAIIMYYFQDVISKDSYKLDFINSKPEEVDMILTYDKNDAKKYNLLFHNLPYSYLSKYYKSINKSKYDICFVGLGKDRFNEIENAFNILKKKGVKCYFYIVDKMKTSLSLPEEGFIVSKKGISYKKYLNIINNSKCILEIIQNESVGNTTRVYEAIEFDKFLLTNNLSLIDDELYDDRYMYIYKDLTEFNIDLLNQKVLYHTKDLIRPQNFFEDLEKELDNYNDKKSDRKI